MTQHKMKISGEINSRKGELKKMNYNEFYPEFYYAADETGYGHEDYEQEPTDKYNYNPYAGEVCEITEDKMAEEGRLSVGG